MFKQGQEYFVVTCVMSDSYHANKAQLDISGKLVALAAQISFGEDMPCKLTCCCNR